MTIFLKNAMLTVAIRLTEVEYHMEYDPWDADRLGELSGQVGFFHIPCLGTTGYRSVET